MLYIVTAGLNASLVINLYGTVVHSQPPPFSHAVKSPLWGSQQQWWTSRREGIQGRTDTLWSLEWILYTSVALTRWKDSPPAPWFLLYLNAHCVSVMCVKASLNVRWFVYTGLCENVGLDESLSYQSNCFYRRVKSESLTPQRPAIFPSKSRVGCQARRCYKLCVCVSVASLSAY